MVTISKTNFKEREDSLRELIRLRKQEGISVLQLASDMGVHEKVLRDFSADQSSKSLSPKNYNSIINSLSYEALQLDEVDFGGLVRFLDGVKKENIRWEFTSRYEKEEIKLYKNFKKFIEEDADVVRNKTSKVSFLECVRNRDDDPFERIEKIASYKAGYKEFFSDLRVYAGIPIQCLWENDEVPIILLLSTENSLEKVITLNQDKKVLLFNPKQK
jgi:transcriptional regulator with XRE-family HTH domain